jgi:hypothetical protein
MATVCDCNASLGNSGLPNCVYIPNVTYKLIVTPTFDSTGAKNYIDTTATLDNAFFTDLLNAGRSGATNTDEKQRIYPIGAFKNVEDIRGEDVTESFNDNSTSFIQEGTRTFTGMIIDRPSPTLLGKMKSWRCSQISAYIVDIDGNLYGNGSEADKLYPFRLDSETWSPKFMKTADATVAKLQLDFTYAKDEADEDIKMILADETTPDVRDLNGLLDVNAAAATSISTTGFVTSLTYDYGSAVTAQNFKGAVLADFDLNEVSPTPGAIVITSVTESPDGTYTFVIPAATSADVLELDLQKDGYEMTTLTITIP